ncbi:MAG: glycosyltransferase, partial [Candidatus Hadarchaeota archaeon]|nr:glycosyltransferase [Candidatus Hadarchaeota archaeon]
TVLVSLGLQGKPSWSPPSVKDNRILTFGKWGNAKDPEPVIHAFLRREIEGQLVVGGGPTPERKGFVERLRRNYASEKVIFTGYVPESDIPNLFHSANLVVLQYKENPGNSAVLLQVCQYGRVPVIRRLPTLEQMVGDLGLIAYFYNTEEELGELLQVLLSDKDSLVEAGWHNYCQVQHLTMDKVSEVYWRLLEE